MEFVRWIALAALVLFSGYTLYTSRNENFWKSFRSVMALKWGRQVVLDLYLGLLIFHLFVYLHEGSLLKTIAWLIPSLILGNIVPLIYLVVNLPFANF